MADTDTTDAPETDAPDTDPATTDDKAPPDTSAEPVQLPDDHPVVKSLAAVRGELREAQSKLKEREDAEKDDLTRLTEDRDGHKAKVGELETEVGRLRAALNHGLSKDDLDLLGNGTAEEIEARAKRLADRLGDKSGRRPTKTLGQPEGDPKGDPDEWLRKAARG